MAKSKKQIWILIVLPVSKPPQLPKMGFLERKAGRGGGGPKFRFSAKNQAPPLLQIGFLAFWGLEQGWQNPKIDFCNLVFWPVANPPQLPKMGFLAFCQAPSKPTKKPIWDFGNEGGDGGGGGGTKFRFSAKNQAPPLLQIGFLAFWGLWARVAKSKKQIWILIVLPVSKPPQLPKMGFLERKAGRGGGGGPKFRFSAKNQAPPILQIGFLAFWGLEQGWQNPKIKLVICFFGLFPSPASSLK